MVPLRLTLANWGIMGGNILPMVLVGDICIVSPVLAVLVRRTVSGIDIGGTLVPRDIFGTVRVERSISSVPGDGSAD
jgi:hypothetical protein